MSGSEMFAPRGTTAEIEEGLALSPKWDANGLITAVVTDATSGVVLMLAHMNAEALALTIETAVAHFWSRSRGKLWKKGESSGNTLRVVELRVDCDQDAVWLRVEQAGEAACHTGRTACFYRAVPLGAAATPAMALEWRNAERHFDPQAVYGAHVHKAHDHKDKGKG